MDGFREIYELHHAAVYRLALFLTGDPARAEDLAADTFVRAWTARHRIRQGTVRAYLLTIARNLHRDQMRAGRHRLVDLNDTLPDSQPTADVRVEHESSLLEVRGRLRHLARGDRRALLLHAVRQMSYAEVAETLGITIGAVKTRIARCPRRPQARDSTRENGEAP